MRTKSIETTVGLFMLIGFGSLVYLALQLGEVPFLSRASTYSIQAVFDNVAGVKKGGAVQIAGVVVGEVAGIHLGEDETAVVELTISKEIKVPVDSIASVKSQGIIGDKYIQLSLGGDDENLEQGGTIVDTESSVDIESLISKFAFGSAK